MHDPTKGSIIETNILDQAIEGHLGQKDKKGKLRMVVFYLRKLILAELNYDIVDKELLAIVEALQH